MQFPVEAIITQKGHKTIHSLLSELCKPPNTSKYRKVDLRFLRRKLKNECVM